MSGAPIAVLTPMANPTVERELRQLLPADCAYVVGRLVSTEQDSTHRLRLYAEQLAASLDQFGGMPLDSIAFACTASSYLVGQSGEERIGATINRPVLWAAQAIRRGLAQIGAHRIAVISPYPAEIHLAGIAYWRSAGFEVIDHRRVEIGSADTRAIYGLSTGAAHDALAAAKAAKPDAVLLSGTGMPTLALLDAAGEPPVLSSNQCLAAAMIAQSKAPT